MKMAVSRVVVLVETDQRFRGVYCLHHQCDHPETLVSFQTTRCNNLHHSHMRINLSCSYAVVFWARRMLDVLWTCWSVHLRLKVLIVWWGFIPLSVTETWHFTAPASLLHWRWTHIVSPTGSLKETAMTPSAPRCNHDINFFPTWTINHHFYDSFLHHRTRTCYLMQSPLAMELLDHQNWGSTCQKLA
jgi:hypothetical protein